MSVEKAGKTVDEVWREIVMGRRNEMIKEEADEMMTLEDFLMKEGAIEDAVISAAQETEGMDVKVPSERLSGVIYTFDSLPTSSSQVEGSIIDCTSGMGIYDGGRGKRGRLMMEPLDKAAAQRQRRMIKNRESAARSRERKQAYQVELESLVARLKEENERLSREKAGRTKERYKKLLEKVIPVNEKRRPRSALRRICSLEW